MADKRHDDRMSMFRKRRLRTMPAIFTGNVAVPSSLSLPPDSIVTASGLPLASLNSDALLQKVPLFSTLIASRSNDTDRAGFSGPVLASLAGKGTMHSLLRMITTANTREDETHETKETLAATETDTHRGTGKCIDLGCRPFTTAHPGSIVPNTRGGHRLRRCARERSGSESHAGQSPGLKG